MTDLTKLMNDVQRSVIDPQDRSTVCKAVQEYYKYLASVGFMKKEEAEVDANNGSEMDAFVMEMLDKFNKRELEILAGIKGIAFDEDMTKGEMIETLKEN